MFSPANLNLERKDKERLLLPSLDQTLCKIWGPDLVRIFYLAGLVKGLQSSATTPRASKESLTIPFFSKAAEEKQSIHHLGFVRGGEGSVNENNKRQINKRKSTEIYY
jgi:hypothetical protein